jgi:hypothetical protein
MGNINNKNIHKFSDLENKKNHDELFMICRTFNYCNLDNNYDVLITINMESKSIINKENKYLVKEYNTNIQKNTIYIKAREYKSIPVCYYYDDWKGTIKLNGLIIFNNFKIKKKLIYDVIDTNKCIKNFYDINKYQLYKNQKILSLNNCIYVSFEFNNTKNEPLYFCINIKSDDFGKQANIYEITPSKYFMKTFCFYNTNWHTNDKGLNWIVADNTFKEIHYSDLNFKLNKNIFKIYVNIEDYPYNKSSIKIT